MDNQRLIAMMNQKEKMDRWKDGRMGTQPNRCTGREQGRGKGTRNIGSGVFGTFGTHIEVCGVLLSK